MQYIYKYFFRKLLFLLDSERAHDLSLKSLSLLNKLHLAKFLFARKSYYINNNITVANLKFKNHIGIAAGLDKDAKYIDALASLGVGFIEVGTVTPRPQQGNPMPRLFRLKKQAAIINRMGFNNQGLLSLINNIKSSNTYKLKQDPSYSDKDLLPVLGINIGKNFDTSNESAIDDYIKCLQDVYQYADYITINISSPNTKDLRELQKADYLQDFLSSIKNKQLELSNKYSKYIPLALKIAPDLSEVEIKNICNLCYKNKIDIIIISNTTNDDNLLYDCNNNKIQGGLSGKPVFEKSNQVLAKIKNNLLELSESNDVGNMSNKHNISIIGVGGVDSVDTAKSKLKLGADLVQIYTGLIYQGPGVITSIINNIK